MAEETKQQVNFKDQMRELSTVDYSEYNKKARALKENFYNTAVEMICNRIKDEIKKRVQNGKIAEENGRRFVEGDTWIYYQYTIQRHASEWNDSEKKQVEKLYEEFKKIPERDRDRIEKFFGEVVIECRLLVVHTCKIYRKKSLFRSPIYNHFFEFSYDKRMIEFLNIIREKLASDGIYLESCTQKVRGFNLDTLTYSKFDEHKLIEVQNGYFTMDYSRFYTIKDCDNDVIGPTLQFKMFL
ncbi:MAG: hypothetical protein IJ400_02740 [Clostridia bacterium]|nr:hypothetical protein [Clostridia bacterium]